MIKMNEKDKIKEIEKENKELRKELEGNRI